LAQYHHRSVGAFNRAVIDQLSSKPGVIAVAISNAVAAPMFPRVCVHRRGRFRDHWKLKFARFTSVYGDYFGAMGIPLLEGRTFTMHDIPTRRPW